MKKITINQKTRKIISVCVIVILAISIAATAFVCGWHTHKEATKEYIISVKVTEIIEDRNEVFFETASGHIFYIVTDEVFAQFEKYEITFDTMGTPTIEDDEIVVITREINIS